MKLDQDKSIAFKQNLYEWKKITTTAFRASRNERKSKRWVWLARALVRWTENDGDFREVWHDICIQRCENDIRQVGAVAMICRKVNFWWCIWMNNLLECHSRGFAWRNIYFACWFQNSDAILRSWITTGTPAKVLQGSSKQCLTNPSLGDCMISECLLWS